LSRSGGLGVVVQERRPGRRCPGAEAWASLSRSGGLGVVVRSVDLVVVVQER
jgi:hypothetical protein